MLMIKYFILSQNKNFYQNYKKSKPFNHLPVLLHLYLRIILILPPVYVSEIPKMWHTSNI